MSYDQEAIEAERLEADMEMAALQQAGHEASRAYRKSAALAAKGDLIAAAMACRHGWGYPLKSLAAKHESDPRIGEPGWRCKHCNSVLTGEPWEAQTIIYPCEPRW